MPEPDAEDLYGEPYPTEEFLNDWLARTAEIILNYKPSLLYFDWWVQHQAFKPYLKKLAAFYYNCGVKWGKDVKICYKHDAMMFGSGIVEVERGGFAEAKPYDWQTDTAVARNSWCYTDTLAALTPHPGIIITFRARATNSFSKGRPVSAELLCPEVRIRAHPSFSIVCKA